MLDHICISEQALNMSETRKGACERLKPAVMNLDGGHPLQNPYAADIAVMALLGLLCG